MKSKKLGLAMQWIIAIVILIICFRISIFSGGKLSALKVHEASEKSYHYGPSEVVNTIDLNRCRIYLCRYKNWFSADTVKKGIVFWYQGNEGGGTEIDYNKQVTYSKSAEGDTEGNRLMKIYGYVNDEEITTICLECEEGLITEVYNLDKSRLFIFCWQDNKEFDYKYLVGADENGQILYKETMRMF